MAGVCSGPGPCDTSSQDRSPKKNWVEKVGGLPLYIRAISAALERSGHPRSEAIQLAVGTVQRWARGQGNVTVATRARAAAALAEWEAKKAAAHTTSVPTSERQAINLASSTAANAGASSASQGNTAASGGGNWNSSAHPRASKGSTTGGQFITAGSGGLGSSQQEQDQVKAVQDALGLGVTGSLSKQDASDIAGFQRANGLQADGVVGTQTAAAIRALQSGKAPGSAKGVKPGALTNTDKAQLQAKGKQRNLSVSLANPKGSMPGSRYPIPDVTHLKKAVMAYGRGKPADKPKIKRHIIRMALQLKRPDLIPDSWKPNS